VGEKKVRNSAFITERKVISGKESERHAAQRPSLTQVWEGKLMSKNTLTNWPLSRANSHVSATSKSKQKQTPNAKGGKLNLIGLKDGYF